MGWETITLSEVADSGPKTGTVMEPGTQIVRLLGAKPDTYQPNALAFDLAVDEGGYKSRRIFPTLPDPAKQAWAANAAKHLASVLGVTQEPGESVIAMFNRAAQLPNRFSVEVTKEEFTRRNGEPGAKNNIQFFSAQAVA
jgi:hypothetical protein